MSREFDQSTFELGLRGFSSPLYFNPAYLSDVSQGDIDTSYFSSNALTNSPAADRQPNLRNINNRTKTPGKINNKISSLFNFHNV